MTYTCLADPHDSEHREWVKASQIRGSDFESWQPTTTCRLDAMYGLSVVNSDGMQRVLSTHADSQCVPKLPDQRHFCMVQSEDDSTLLCTEQSKFPSFLPGNARCVAHDLSNAEVVGRRTIGGLEFHVLAEASSSDASVPLETTETPAHSPAAPSTSRTLDDEQDNLAAQLMVPVPSEPTWSNLGFPMAPTPDLLYPAWTDSGFPPTLPPSY